MHYTNLLLPYHTIPYHYNTGTGRSSIKEAFPLCQESSDVWRKNKSIPLVDVSALCFLQLSGRKNIQKRIPKGSLAEQIKEENQEDLVTRVHLENDY